MARTLDETIASLPREQRERVAARTADLVAEELSLREGNRGIVWLPRGATTMRRPLGILFLIAAAVAAIMAYLSGGASGDSVNFASVTQRSLVFALTVPICILIGFLLLRQK